MALEGKDCLSLVSRLDMFLNAARYSIIADSVKAHQRDIYIMSSCQPYLSYPGHGLESGTIPGRTRTLVNVIEQSGGLLSTPCPVEHGRCW